MKLFDAFERSNTRLRQDVIVRDLEADCLENGFCLCP